VKMRSRHAYDTKRAWNVLSLHEYSWWDIEYRIILCEFSSIKASLLDQDFYVALSFSSVTVRKQ
jgi:hypothetical protein